MAEDKNPLTKKQLEFFDKLNSATFIMADYYDFRSNLMDAKFIWVPSTSLYILDIKEMGYKLEYKKPLNYRRPEVYITDEVEYFEDKYPLYVPVYKLVRCLITSLSPRDNSRMRYTEKTANYDSGYFTKNLLKEINENIKKIRNMNVKVKIK